MPTDFIKKLAKDHSKTVKEVEEFWLKAKDLAKAKFKEGKPEFYPYAVGILKKMLRSTGPKKISLKNVFKNSLSSSDTSLSKQPLGIESFWDKMPDKAKQSYLDKQAGKDVDSKDADDAVEKIWDKLTPAQRNTHKKIHTKSKLPINISPSKKQATDPAKPDKKVDKKYGRKHEHPDPPIKVAESDKEEKDTASATKDWWDKLSVDHQNKYLRDHPNSKKAKRHRGIVRNLVKMATGKIQKAVEKTGKDYKFGMAGIKNFRDGKPMSARQKEGLKSTAVKVGALALGALAGIALFTPLAPFAMNVGSEWLNSISNRSESTSSAILDNNKIGEEDLSISDKDSKDQLDWMVKNMSEWLSKQDVPKLVEKLKSQKEKA